MDLTDEEIEEKAKQAVEELRQTDPMFVKLPSGPFKHILEDPILNLSAAILVLAQVEAGKLAVINGMDDMRESFREAKLLILEGLRK